MPTVQDQRAFIDITTTGDDPLRDEIVEISILVVSQNVVQPLWHRFVRPRKALDVYFRQLHPQLAHATDAAKARSTIINELHSLLTGKILLGFHMRRQWLFLRQFCAEAGLTLVATPVSLESFPQYKLETKTSDSQLKVIEYYQAWQSMMVKVTEPVVESLLKQRLRTPATPKNITREDITSLPNTVGVYLFYDQQDCLLYVGKSIHIRERILSHFYSDAFISTEVRLKEQIKRVETITTAGELEALITEAQLIKARKPIYNRLLRQKQDCWQLKLLPNVDGYLETKLSKMTRVPMSEVREDVAFFRTKRAAQTVLENVVDGFQLCPKLLGLEKNSRACFNYSLALCQGACVGEQTAEEHNQQLVSALEPYFMPRWNWSHPFIFSEKNEETGQVTHHVLDNWCYLGGSRSDVSAEESKPVIGDCQECVFDHDLYHILKNVLLKIDQ